MELENRFSISGPELREIINEARTQGYPICSSTQGYWYAANEKEINKTIAQLESRISRIETAKEGMIKSLKEWKNERLNSIYS